MARSITLFASAALLAGALTPAALAAQPAAAPDAKAAATDCDGDGASAAKDSGRVRAPAACHAINTKGTGMAGRMTGAGAAQPPACPAVAGRGLVTPSGRMQGTAAVSADARTGLATGVAAGGPVTITATYRDSSSAAPSGGAPEPAAIAITEEGGNNQHADRPKKPKGVAATTGDSWSSSSSGSSSSSSAATEHAAGLQAAGAPGRSNEHCPTPDEGGIKKSKSNISTN